MASLAAVLAFTPPMLATSARPAGSLDGWVVEPKADGWRAQVAVHDGRCAVWTRIGRDISAKVRELAALAELTADCVLDGELVAGAGLPVDFYPLAGLVSARRRSSPVTFVAFDVLRLDGRSLLDLRPGQPARGARVPRAPVWRRSDGGQHLSWG